MCVLTVNFSPNPLCQMGFAGGGDIAEQPLLSQARFPTCYQKCVFKCNKYGEKNPYIQLFAHEILTSSSATGEHLRPRVPRQGEPSGNQRHTGQYNDFKKLSAFPQWLPAAPQPCLRWLDNCCRQAGPAMHPTQPRCSAIVICPDPKHCIREEYFACALCVF